MRKIAINRPFWCSEIWTSFFNVSQWSTLSAKFPGDSTPDNKSGALFTTPILIISDLDKLPQWVYIRIVTWRKAYSAKRGRWRDDIPMLGQRRRRWTSIGTSSRQRVCVQFILMTQRLAGVIHPSPHSPPPPPPPPPPPLETHCYGTYWRVTDMT